MLCVNNEQYKNGRPIKVNHCAGYVHPHSQAWARLGMTRRLGLLAHGCHAGGWLCGYLAGIVTRLSSTHIVYKYKQVLNK